MATKLGNLTVPNGTYTKNGEEKTRWARMGILLQKEDGTFAIKIDAIPGRLFHPDNDGWVQVFPDQEDRPQANSGGGFRNKSSGAPDDDVPF